METTIQRASRIKEERNLKEIEVKSAFHSVKEVTSVNQEERTIVKYVSKPTLDRSNEIVISQGIDLTDFIKNPVVLFGHDYHNNLPIGKDLWIKFDGQGLLAKQQYANHELANDIFNMHKDGFPLASSIGFIPMKTQFRGAYNKKEWDEYLTNVSGMYNIDKQGLMQADVIYEKCLLLEHSDVNVPANPDALALSIKSGKIAFKSDELQKSFENIMLKNDIIGLEAEIEQLKEDRSVLKAMIDKLSKEMVINNKSVENITESYIRKKVNDKIEEISAKIGKKFGMM